MSNSYFVLRTAPEIEIKSAEQIRSNLKCGTYKNWNQCQQSTHKIDIEIKVTDTQKSTF